MSLKRDDDPYRIIWLVRRLFRAFSRKSAGILEQFGITVADRAVLEFLYPDKKLSVPEIAERYQVTRQHVQVTVNALLEQRLVMTRRNPRHKRSPLVVLSRKGRDLFANILVEDGKAVEALFRDMSAQDCRVTRNTLETLLHKLNEGEQT